MHHTLEGSRLFPIIAWTLVISFAFFTYTLTIELEENIESLDRTSASSEQYLKTSTR